MLSQILIIPRFHLAFLLLRHARSLVIWHTLWDPSDTFRRHLCKCPAQYFSVLPDPRRTARVCQGDNLKCRAPECSIWTGLWLFRLSVQVIAISDCFSRDQASGGARILTLDLGS